MFTSKDLANYKKCLVQEMLGTEEKGAVQRQELGESYIPLKLLEYYPLGENYQGVVKRRLFPLSKVMAGEKLWLVGKAGSGKTTLFRKLALMLANDKLDSDKIPVYINLRNMTQEEQSFVEHIAQNLEERNYSNPQKFIKKKLQDGKWFMLLDGLDEISTSGDIKNVLDKINQFLSEYGEYKNTLLIASRRTKHNHSLDEIAKVNLSELSEQQIAKYIQPRLPEDSNPDQLLKELKENVPVKRLARTPLGLSFICTLHQGQKDLPHNRAGLYKAYIQHTLKDLGSVWLRTLNFKQMLKVLEEMAYACHINQRIQFTGEDFNQLIQETLPKQKFSLEQTTNLLTEILKNSTPLTACSEKDTYKFTHLSLQEFLTAQKISRLPEGIKFILGKHNERWWANCVGLYAGLMNNPSGVIISLREVNPEMALTCYAEAKQIYPDLHEVLQKDMVCGLIDTLHVEGLVQAIINRADSATIDLLKDILHNSTNLGLKVRCTQVLCEIGSEESTKTIVEELSNNNNIDTKRCIIFGFDYLWINPRSILDVLQDNDKQFVLSVQKELQASEAKN